MFGNLDKMIDLLGKQTTKIYLSDKNPKQLNNNEGYYECCQCYFLKQCQI